MNTTLTWKKIGGEWVVYGEHLALKHKVGCMVSVTSAKGEVKQVQIVKLGTPTVVAGHVMVHGYVARSPRRSSTSGQRRVVNDICQICFSRQWWNCGCDDPADA